MLSIGQSEHTSIVTGKTPCDANCINCQGEILFIFVDKIHSVPRERLDINRARKGSNYLKSHLTSGFHYR